MNLKPYNVHNWADLAQQTKWSTSLLAKRCGVSLRTLERHFLKEVGQSPKAWIAALRSKRAGELLQNGASVKEAANCLYYKHPSHLTNEFKKHWGHCPTKHSASKETSKIEM